MYVITRGQVAVDNGQVILNTIKFCYHNNTTLKVHVVKGSGQFIPRPCYSDIVYDAITQRDKVTNGYHVLMM